MEDEKTLNKNADCLKHSEIYIFITIFCFRYFKTQNLQQILLYNLLRISFKRSIKDTFYFTFSMSTSYKYNTTESSPS